MITIFTGMPGAGKTAAMIDLLSKLPGDRPIYVHYDPAAKRRPDISVLHESLQLPHQPIHADEWHKDLPNDAILIIDEVQDVWRPRGSTAKVPDAIAALETHRHSGVDIYLTTQAPRLVDANVRGLVGRHVHIRDTGWLGRHWYEWPEINESMQWKTCPVKKSYKLPKGIFDLYKSATTHNKPIRTVPPALYWAIAATALASILIFLTFRIFLRKPEQPPQAPSAQATQATQANMQNASMPLDRPQIDDRVDFIPRVSNKPESAPAYDQLRKINTMPVVTIGICTPTLCKCYTDQGTNAGLSHRDCLEFVQNPPFNPYRLASHDTRDTDRDQQRQGNGHSKQETASNSQPVMERL